MEVGTEENSLKEPLCRPPVETEKKLAGQRRFFAPSKDVSYFNNMNERNTEDDKALFYARYFMGYAWIHLAFYIPFLYLYSRDLSSALSYKTINMTSQTFLVFMQTTFFVIFARLPQMPTVTYLAGTILSYVGNWLFFLYAILRCYTHDPPIWEPADIESDNPPSKEDEWMRIMQWLCLIGAVMFVVSCTIFTCITVPVRRMPFRTYYKGFIGRFPRPWRQEDAICVGNFAFLVSSVLWLLETIRWMYPLSPHEHAHEPVSISEHLHYIVHHMLALSRIVAVVATVLGLVGRIYLMWGSITPMCDVFFRRTDKAKSLWTKIRPLAKRGNIPIALATPFFATMFNVGN